MLVRVVKEVKELPGRLKAVCMLFANNLAGVFVLWLIGAGIAGCVFWLAEDKGNLWDGYWWGIVTGLSIGYGDLFPVTVIGRVAGMIWGVVSIMVIIPTVIGLFLQVIIKSLHMFTDIEQKLLMAFARFAGRAGRIIIANQVTLNGKLDLIGQMVATGSEDDRLKLKAIRSMEVNDGSELDDLWQTATSLEAEEDKETQAERC